MAPTAWIATWGVLFVGTHVLLPAQPVRPYLAARLGQRGYRLLYWLVSLVTFAPFVLVFSWHKGTGPVLWSVESVPALWWSSHPLMAIALAVLAAGLIDRSPASMFGGSTEVRGILKLTRSPVFIGLSLFGISHMLVNGTLPDVIFFGSFPLLGLIGGWHQDRRKRGEGSLALARFIEETSLLPGLALLAGKQRWTGADTPWLAIAVAAVLYVAFVFLGLHAWLVGGDPLG